ncbi:MAG: hypothetical protein NTV34_03545 [Proteobacteria bacterium]|nr:hypothetical protein [Pseudomonadota bacterium]
MLKKVAANKGVCSSKSALIAIPSTTVLRFTQTDFTEQLASPLPDPCHNQTCYHGIFAPGHAWRARIVPGPQKKRPEAERDDDPPKPTKPSSGRAAGEYNIPWAELLRKSFGIDPELCVCGAKMRVIESVTKSEQISETMVAMGLASAPPPLGRARRAAGELDYAYGLTDFGSVPERAFVI